MADPVLCATMNCREEGIVAEVFGTFLQEEGEPDLRVGYCHPCARIISGAGLFAPDSQRPLPGVIVERMAVALWSHGTAVVERERDRSQWANEDDSVREYWLGQARVAMIAALYGVDLVQDWVVTVEHTDGHDEHPAVSRNAAIRKADRFALAGGRAQAAQRWTVTFIQPVMRAMGKRIVACQYNASPHQLNDECVNVETA